MYAAMALLDSSDRGSKVTNRCSIVVEMSVHWLTMSIGCYASLLSEKNPAVSLM